MNETQDNQYASPRKSDPPSDRSRLVCAQRWWSIYSIACLLIAMIPTYGFYTHAALDSQKVVLWLLLAWTITVVNTFVCLMRCVLLSRRKRFGALCWFVISACLSGFLYFGFYGIGRAVGELWVG